jgi:hypothetical protein
MGMLQLLVADKVGLQWAQEQVIAHHYLHKPVDVRCSPLAYLISYQEKPVGCLIYGRPESQKVNDWYGSVGDILTGKCYLSRWQILNLARVWLHPSIQQNGEHYIANAATWVIAQSLRRVVYDYLIEKPPVWIEEPYEIREVLSYCDTRIHHGTLYKASNFQLRRANKKGIETYARTVRRLTHAEKREIAARSQADKRCQKLRLERAIERPSVWEIA